MQKLCTDVSCFKTLEGWLYFSPVMDLFGRKIIAYEISKHNDLKLALGTLEKLSRLKNCSEVGKFGDSLFHIDQGCLYTSPIFREKLKEMGFVCAKYEPTWQLLGQCLHGTLLWHAQSGKWLR